jgi:hypothetical protein
MTIKHYILTLMLCWANLLWAQNIKFTASASKNTVGTGEVFEVTFAVNGNMDRFTPPDFGGLQVVGGPNQSSSMESINGTTTMNSAVSYEVVAAKEGEFTINPASVVVNGRSYTSTAIRIKVIKGRPVQQNSRAQGIPDNTVADAKMDLSKTLFLRAIVDKDNVYQGQQLTLTYRIYTRVGIAQSQVNKFPDLTGFYNQDVKDQPQQAKWNIETYKGLKYNVADIKQVILFPEHAGNITIDPFEMTFIARVAAPAHDIMEQFFGNSQTDVKYNAKSLPLIVHVKPLPEAGKPVTFTGAVGNFSLDASVDKSQLKANESLNYKLKITGAGNIKLLKNLNVIFPLDFEKYDPKVTDTVTEHITGVAGSRFYNYLLIPRHQGDYTIDPVKFSYFNPATGRYVTLSTRAFKIKVDKGKIENNVTAFASDKQDVKILDKDIRYIKTDEGDITETGDEFFGSVSYYFLLLLGPIVAIAALIYRNQNRKYNSDVVKVKGRRAGRVAAKHLANAQKQLSANNTKAFYEAIFRGLYGYLSDKLNIAAADLDRENIAAALKARAVDDEVIGRLTDTLDLCEMARYAPVTQISEQQVFDKAKGIINDIESKI